MTFCHLFVAILYSYYWITFHLTLIGIYSFILRSIVHIYRRITNSALYHRSRMNVWRVSFDSSMENVCLFLEMCPKQNGKSTIYRFIRLQTVGIFHEVHNLCRFFAENVKFTSILFHRKLIMGPNFIHFCIFFIDSKLDLQMFLHLSLLFHCISNFKFFSTRSTRLFHYPLHF